MAGKFSDRACGWIHKKSVPTRGIQVPCDGHQSGRGARIVDAVDGLFRGDAPMDTSRLGCSIHPRCLPNEILVNPSDLLYPFQGILLDHSFLEGVPAVDVFLHKLPVIKLFLNDDMVKTQGESGICSRTDLKPEVCFIRNKSLARIDADQLGSLFIGPPEILSLIFIRIIPLRITGPHDDTFRPAFIIGNGQSAAGNQG